jgi:hypothetical protein
VNEKNLAKILELLEPYFKKKFEKEEGSVKTAKMVNAIIKNISNIDRSKITVILSGDPEKIEFIVTNPNINIDYKIGDSVQLIYYDSLRNAKIFAKA